MHHARSSVLVVAMAAGMAAPALAGDGAPQVRLRYACFDPLVSTPPVPEALRAGPGNELFLVQFASTPTETMREELRALGGVVERFLTDNTHVVRMTAAARAKAAALPGVRWVGPYHPAYRLSEEARADVILGPDSPAMKRYSIQCMRRAAESDQQETIAALIRSLGGIIEPIPPEAMRLEATLTPAMLLAVAQRNEVNFIDTWGPPGHDMHLIRQLGGATPLLSGVGISGQGVRGELLDGDLNADHVALQNPPPLIHGPFTAHSTDFGTATFGMIFANWPGMPDLTGILPDRERGIFGDYFALVPLQQRVYELIDPAGPYRGVFLSSSVGSPHVTTYSTISAAIDDILFRADLVMTQSMGNTGALPARPESWAKNIVSVNGINYQGTRSRADDTGAGIGSHIAADGRVKPDLAHAQDGIDAIAGATTTSTGVFSGTSASTAITAGYFGLIMQMWHEGVFPGFGGGTSVFADRPHAAMARALAINTAYRYDWTAGGPNSTITRGVQGWGMIDAGALYAARGGIFIVNQDRLLTPGQTATYTLTVPPGQPLLRATMVYRDPMGNPAAAQARINDLSLKVIAPGGTFYWGNNGLLSGNLSAPGGQANTVDTVENVFVGAPQAGVWTFQVIASEIVQDGHPEDPALNADFALVVTGIVPECYANCDGSTAPPLLNINDLVCFQQRFAAGDSYANCDGSTVPPVLNINDFVCFQQRFAQGCP